MSSGYGEIYEKSTQRSELLHHFNVFPNSVREAFSFITSADYDHDKLKFDVRMKGTRVMTTATFYSALPAQRTSAQTSSKNSKIICLKTQR